MQLTTAYNIHNRGAFHLENTALRSGDSSKDRQSGGETYMPFAQGDEARFAQTQQLWSEPSAQSGMNLLTDYIFNVDTRLITSLIATMIFSVMFQAILNAPLLVTLPVGFVFFLLWYIMSFFNFQRVLANAQQGPRQMRHIHHQVSATF